jgi:hypothetical protein
MGNFSLGIHRVTNIRVGSVRTNSSPGDRVYATREITIETSDGEFELVLFSEEVSADDDCTLLEVKS